MSTKSQITDLQNQDHWSTKYKFTEISEQNQQVVSAENCKKKRKKNFTLSNNRMNG